jgi:hypothetical protein
MSSGNLDWKRRNESYQGHGRILCDVFGVLLMRSRLCTKFVTLSDEALVS